MENEERGVKLLRAKDERCWWVREQLSNYPWLKYISVVQGWPGSGFVNHTRYDHGLNYPLPIKSQTVLCMSKAPMTKGVPFH